MEAKLYHGQGLSPEQIVQNLEANCIDVEESYDFLRPYTDEEIEETRLQYAESGAELNKLEEKLKAVSEPIKAEMKPLKEVNLRLRKNLSDGGERVSGKIYLFADYESNLMTMYDERGVLIGTRPMSRKERQLHINSFKKVSNG